MSLYWRLIGISLKSTLQHRASFFLLLLSQFLSSTIEIFGIWILFDRFRLIQGWTVYELALIFGIIHMGFALSEIFARGFDKFSHLIKRAEFDRLLLRPIDPFVQVAAREVHPLKIGRFLQGLLVLLYGVTQLHVPLLSTSGLIIALAICGTACLFYGLFVIQATLCFWSAENLSLMDIATYGGRETGQYPMTIYSSGFQFVFTFLIPIACVSYYPAAAILHHDDLPTWVGLITPFSGAIFLYLSYRLWSVGVRHYHSTGS